MEEATSEKAPDQVLEVKVHKFLPWLESNGIRLQGCSFKPCKEGLQKGYGIYSNESDLEGIVMVTPLCMAITPMSVLLDPVLGSHYQRLFEDGEVDDRLLIMLFLIVERLRGRFSFWAPYLDMLPTTFGTPLWHSEEELLELKGTALFDATIIQHKSLRTLFEDKVKALVESFLSFVGCFARDILYRDFLWAYCTFWSRALNIPFPRAFVFPTCFPTPPGLQFEEERGFLACSSKELNSSNVPEMMGGHMNALHYKDNLVLDHGREHENTLFTINRLENPGFDSMEKPRELSMMALKDNNDLPRVSGSMNEFTTIWVEGLVPGIDFCNHDPKSVALWEVDGERGNISGTPFSMYLITAPGAVYCQNKEICISYGNKGNEELLFLYGFTIDNNADDYLMLHFPGNVLEQDPLFQSKTWFLGGQKLPLRWLLPASALERTNLWVSDDDTSEKQYVQQNSISSFSWSGQRKAPSNLHSTLFPEDLMATMRVIAMQEEEVSSTTSLLEQLSHVPSEEDLRAAVWEVCGNSGAFQLLTDILTTKMVDMENASGTEEADADLLKMDILAKSKFNTNQQLACMPRDLVAVGKKVPLSDFQRNCIVYRKGQKHLVKKFLREAEKGFKVCSDEHI